MIIGATTLFAFWAGRCGSRGGRFLVLCCWSIAIVAALYLSMNVSVLGVIPLAGVDAVRRWRKFAVVAVLMERTFGRHGGEGAGGAGDVDGVCVSVFAAAGVLAGSLCGGGGWELLSRLLEAACRHRFPNVSLLALGAVATVFCFFDLSQVIAALVAIRILLQYVLQQVGVIVLRVRSRR